jgi:hypothetical protein
MKLDVLGDIDDARIAEQPCQPRGIGKHRKIRDEGWRQIVLERRREIDPDDDARPTLPAGLLHQHFGRAAGLESLRIAGEDGGRSGIPGAACGNRLRHPSLARREEKRQHQCRPQIASHPRLQNLSAAALALRAAVEPRWLPLDPAQRRFPRPPRRPRTGKRIAAIFVARS